MSDKVLYFWLTVLVLFAPHAFLYWWWSVERVACYLYPKALACQ